MNSKYKNQFGLWRFLEEIWKSQPGLTVMQLIWLWELIVGSCHWQFRYSFQLIGDYLLFWCWDWGRDNFKEQQTILLLYLLLVALFCSVKQHLCRTAFMFSSQSLRMSNKSINVRNGDQVLRKFVLILLKIKFTEAPQSRILEQ